MDNNVVYIVISLRYMIFVAILTFGVVHSECNPGRVVVLFPLLIPSAVIVIVIVKKELQKFQFC